MQIKQLTYIDYHKAVEDSKKGMRVPSMLSGVTLEYNGVIVSVDKFRKMHLNLELARKIIEQVKEFEEIEK